MIGNWHFHNQCNNILFLLWVGSCGVVPIRGGGGGVKIFIFELAWNLPFFSLLNTRVKLHLLMPDSGTLRGVAVSLQTRHT